jgi:type VI secretion system secreted protein VgrG
MTPVPIFLPSVWRARRRGVVAALVALGVGLVAVLPIVGADAAQAPVGLGTATSFAVLAGSGITNTGSTTISGDVGTHPTPSMTGFDTVTVTGAKHPADAVALQAKNDLTTAYNTAAAATPTTAVATELGGRTLTPGVYGADTLGITGVLTLDTLGDPNAVFIFQASSTLITASNSSVIVLDGAVACNVYWQVGTSATLGTSSRFIGTVLASTSITATTGATIQGRLLAQTGAVTLHTNTITRPVCAPAATTTTTPAASTTTSTSAPSTTTTVPGGGTSVPGGSGVAPGGPSPSTPAVTPPAGGTTPSGSSLTATGIGTGTGGPTGSGSTTGGATSRTPGTGFPGLPVTGTDLDGALVGIGALALGTTLLAAARLRRRLTTTA